MINIKGLTYTSKGGKTILKNINYSFAPRKLSAILGANGAGKSTLFKCINHEVKFQEGSIHWQDEDILNIDNRVLSKQKAVLRQQYDVSLPFKAIEIIEMGRYAYFQAYPTQRCKEVIQEVSSIVGVQHLLERNYMTLSGGEQQRVQLARVIAQVWDSPIKERLLLLDEPVSALDIQYQHYLMQLMQQLTQEFQFTVIAIVHDLNLTLQYADHVVLIKKGEIVAADTTKNALTVENIQNVFNIQVAIHENEQPYIQFIPNTFKLNSKPS